MKLKYVYAYFIIALHPSLVGFAKISRMLSVDARINMLTEALDNAVTKFCTTIENSTTIAVGGLSKTVADSLPLVGQETRKTTTSAAHDTQFVLTSLTEEARTAATEIITTARHQTELVAASTGKELRMSTDHAIASLDRLLIHHTKGIALTCAGITGIIASIIMLKNGITKIVEGKTTEKNALTMRKQGRYYTIIGSICMALSFFVVNKSDSIAQFFTRVR